MSVLALLFGLGHICHSITWSLGPYDIPRLIENGHVINYGDSVLYYLGGNTNLTADHLTNLNLDTIYKLDISDAVPSWSLLSATLPVARPPPNHIVKVGDIIYIYANPTLHLFDIPSESFIDNSFISSNPYPDSSVSLTSDDNNKIYFIGGQGAYSQYVTEYDVKLNQWTALSTTAPINWFWLNTIYYPPTNGIYVLGGYSSATSHFRGIYFYDLSTNVWSTELNTMTIDGSYGNSVYIPETDTIYMIEIWWSTASGVNSYNPSTNTVTTEASRPYKECTSGTAAVVFECRLQLFGGYWNGGSLQDEACQTEVLYPCPTPQPTSTTISPTAAPTAAPTDATGAPTSSTYHPTGSTSSPTDSTVAPTVTTKLPSKNPSTFIPTTVTLTTSTPTTQEEAVGDGDASTTEQAIGNGSGSKQNIDEYLIGNVSMIKAIYIGIGILIVCCCVIGLILYIKKRKKLEKEVEIVHVTVATNSPLSTDIPSNYAMSMNVNGENQHDATDSNGNSLFLTTSNEEIAPKMSMEANEDEELYSTNFAVPQQHQTAGASPMDTAGGGAYNVYNNYINWDFNKVYEWIISLENGEYNIDGNNLYQNLQNEDVNGKGLKLLNENDLHRLGIIKLIHKKNILNHIKKLTDTAEGGDQYENNDDEYEYYYD